MPLNPKLPTVFPTAVHMLAAAASASPRREALVCGAERLTYEEYARCVAGFAAELRAVGVQGGRVVVVLGNSVDICIALLAGQAAGAQVAPINPMFTESEIAPLLEDIDPVAIVHDANLTAMIESASKRAGVRSPGRRRPGGPEPHAVAGDAGGDRARHASAPRVARAAALHRRDDRHAEGREPHPFRVRARRRADEQPRADARGGGAAAVRDAAVPHLCDRRRDEQHAVLPRDAGDPAALYAADAVLDALEAESITMLAGGPTMFVGLLSHERLAQRRFPHLRCSYSGASALPEETLRRWESATGAPALEGYGQTESGGGVIFNPLEGVRKPGSVGTPMAGVEVQIVDLATGDTVLPAGETGEIRIRGPQLMASYRGRPEDTAAVLRNGWLYTTDIGHLDADGYLYISDRKKDMVIVSGFNVYPRAVEEVLYRHPDVLEAAVVGEPDAYQGEALKAFVVQRSGGAIDADAVVQHCRAHLAPYKVPRRIVFVDALPKTAVGKIDKRRLSEVGSV
jgi:long-chain acyl-CoA synthetase